MGLENALNFRRSVRVYDTAQPLDPIKVRHCIELATLAPNSSNMQLWEFYHITDPAVIQKMAYACFDQTTVSTASELVVIVSRQDLHREREKKILNFERGNIRRNSPPEKQQKRIKDQERYYKIAMPLLYTRFFGLLGWLRKLIILLCAPFTRVIFEVSEGEMNAVVQKSCALAAQTFMLAMAEQGFDTCPLEGFDSRHIKKLLHLPWGTRINMVITCGIRKGNEGIRGERYRVPFEDVYKRI